MNTVPLVRSIWVQPFLSFFREIGAPLDERVEASSLPPEVAEAPELSCPSRLLFGVVDRLVRETSIGDVGLRVGARTRIRNLGRFGRRVTGERTLREAIRTAQRSMASVHTARQLTLSVVGQRARLSTKLDASQLAPTLWEDQFVLLMLVDLVRMVAGPGWRPETVSFQAALAESDVHCSTLQHARVRYGENATTLEFPRSLLHERLAPAPVRGFDAAFKQHSEVAMKTLPTDLAGSLQVALELLLPQGYTDIESLATIVGTSSRTLQRQLSKRGRTFSEILALSRFGVARRLLDDPSVKVIDVAFEAGYSDPAHFTNAFRRWTGLAPRAYRSAHALATA